MTRQTQLLIVLGGAVALYLFARSDTGAALVTDVLSSGARGIRNNNPGNIRKSATVWAGQASSQTDPAFVQFSAPEYGIRAMAKVLKTYLARGTDTISEIISTWAPSSENNTAAYIASVATQTGLAANSRISEADLSRVIPAIIQHENGAMPYSPALITKGIALS